MPVSFFVLTGIFLVAESVYIIKTIKAYTVPFNIPPRSRLK